MSRESSLSLSSGIGVRLEWSNITYRFPSRGGGEHANSSEEEVLTALNNVSGSASPGRLLALMGPSGAGKSTLLDILCGRRLPISGEERYGELSVETVLLNKGEERERQREGEREESGVGDVGVQIEGQQESHTIGGSATPPKIQSMTGYVMQDPCLMASATVRETFLTSARLRLPRHFSDAQIEELVDELIEDLEMTHRKDAKIGDDMVRGLSGGEKQRVSVGVELVTNPRILFLDEPTSGLDSATACKIVKMLLRLCREHGRTVVCTIHQPNSQITAMFDDIMLLAKGKVVYHGPMSESVAAFAECGFQCPQYANPTDYFMEIITGSDAAPAIDTLANAQMRRRPSKLEVLAESSNTEDVQEVGVEKKKFQLVSSVDDSLVTNRQHQKALQTLGVNELRDKRPPLWKKIQVLCKRFLLDWARNPMMFWAEFSQYVFMGLLIGFMYLERSDEVTNGVFDRVAAIFYYLVCIIFVPTFTVITVFEKERKLLMRELSTRSYGIPTYFFSRTMVTWPMEIGLTTVMAILVYFIIGFRTDGAEYFFFFLLLVVVFQLCSESFGMVVAVCVKNATMGVLVLTVVLLMFVSFAGFLISTTPAYFRWIGDISFINYAYSAMVMNELDGLYLRCDAAINSTICNSDDRADAGPFIPGPLDNGLTKWENFGVLVAMLMIFRLLALFLLELNFSPTFRKSVKKLCRCAK